MLIGDVWELTEHGWIRVNKKPPADNLRIVVDETEQAMAHGDTYVPFTFWFDEEYRQLVVDIRMNAVTGAEQLIIPGPVTSYTVGKEQFHRIRLQHDKPSIVFAIHHQDDQGKATSRVCEWSPKNMFHDFIATTALATTV